MTPAPFLQTTLTSDSPDATREIAARIGRRLTSGMVLAIEGDLGSGKTCFVQGLARGLGVPPEVYVTSPSYTLVNSYDGRLPLHHVDLYRLAGADLEDIGLYDLMAPPAVVAIEWAERMAEDRPQDILEVRLQVTAADHRRLTLSGYGLAAVNLIKALVKTAGE